MKKNYEIKTNPENGKQLCKFKFTWVDNEGNNQEVITNDLDAAATVINLLTGEICLADLEP